MDGTLCSAPVDFPRRVFIVRAARAARRRVARFTGAISTRAKIFVGLRALNDSDAGHGFCTKLTGGFSAGK